MCLAAQNRQKIHKTFILVLLAHFTAQELKRWDQMITKVISFFISSTYRHEAHC